jgi:hypothetical protein
MKHKHHIIPKHIGGTDDPSNLVELTVEEHAEAHRKLWEEHGRWQDFIAWQGLAKIIPSEQIHSEATKMGMKNWWNSLTEEQKLNWIQRCTIRPEGFVRPSGYTYTHTEEAKKKIGLAHKGKIVSEETKRKIVTNRKHATGNRNSMSNPIHRDKVAQSKIGRKRVYMPDGSFKYIRPESA